MSDVKATAEDSRHVASRLLATSLIRLIHMTTWSDFSTVPTL